MPKFFRSIVFALAFLALYPLAGKASQPDTLTPVYFFYTDTFCSDQIILVNNKLYGPFNPSGTEFLPGGAFNGADSFIVVNLTFQQPVEVDYKPVICEGDTLWINGTPYHQDNFLGDEIIPNGASNGCDSILHIELEVRAAPFLVLNDTLCPNDYRMINGKRYDVDNRFGIELLPGASYLGCDSIVYVELGFRQPWVWLGPDREIAIGDTVCLQTLFGQPLVSVTWGADAPCNTPGCLEGCVQPFASTTYQIEVVDENGCILRDDVEVIVSNKNKVYAPNAVNPDAEVFENQYFYLSGDAGVVNIRHLMIWDRWGEIVYDRHDLTPGFPEEGWDGNWRGKSAPNGVYVFWAELERINQTTFTLTGTFSIVR